MRKFGFIAVGTLVLGVSLMPPATPVATRSSRIIDTFARGLRGTVREAAGTATASTRPAPGAAPGGGPPCFLPDRPR